MKTFEECLEQAAINEGWDNGQEFIDWVHEEALNVFMLAAKIYTEQSNSHIHVVMCCIAGAVGQATCGWDVRSSAGVACSEEQYCT